MNQDDIIAKIRSIVRLARRAGTDGERIAAETAATRLAAKHGIALDSIDSPDADFKTGEFAESEWRTRTGIEIGFVTGILRRHFGVILMQNTNGRKCRFTWIGTRANVEVAKYAFDILYREVRKAWAEARIARTHARKIQFSAVTTAASRQLAVLRNIDKKSFMNGWFAVIDRKLTEHPIRPDAEQFSAEKKDAERTLRDMMENKDRNVRDSRKSVATLDAKAAAMGALAADKVNLSHPMDAHGYTGAPAAVGFGNIPLLGA